MINIIVSYHFYRCVSDVSFRWPTWFCSTFGDVISWTLQSRSPPQPPEAQSSWDRRGWLQSLRSATRLGACVRADLAPSVVPVLKKNSDGGDFYVAHLIFIWIPNDGMGSYLHLLATFWDSRQDPARERLQQKDICHLSRTSPHGSRPACWVAATTWRWFPVLSLRCDLCNGPSARVMGCTCDASECPRIPQLGVGWKCSMFIMMFDSQTSHGWDGYYLWVLMEALVF